MMLNKTGLILCSIVLLGSTKQLDSAKLGSAKHITQVNSDIQIAQGKLVYQVEDSKMPKELDDGELGTGDPSSSWNYTDQARWIDEYPYCEGVKLRQSPINIITDEVVFGPRLRLDFKDYNQEITFELINTRHSVSARPSEFSSQPGIHLNFLGGEGLFDLKEIHFHWGTDQDKGSEHEINGEGASAEMHMVHYRQGVDQSQIGDVQNSLVVIGVLIETDPNEHDKLERIVNKTERVNGTDIKYKDNNPINLINLLPKNHHAFYLYNGSLTTPPCYEVVTWLIMSDPVKISQNSLEKLMNLETKSSMGRRKIARNYRELQPLSGRTVYASFNVSETNLYTKLDDPQTSDLNQADDQNKSGLDKQPAQTFFDSDTNNKSIPSHIISAIHSISLIVHELWKKTMGQIMFIL